MDFQCGPAELFRANLGSTLVTSTLAGGKWSEAATWSLGTVPEPNATVYIVGAVELDSETTQVKSLWIGSAGLLETKLDSCYLVMSEILQVDGVDSNVLFSLANT